MKKMILAAPFALVLAADAQALDPLRLPGLDICTRKMHENFCVICTCQNREMWYNSG